MHAKIPDLHVRPVTEDDASEIVLLLNRIIDARSYTAMSERMSVADQIHFIQTLPKRATYLAATDGRSGKLLGVQDCLPNADTPEQADISTFVSLDAFRSGVGSTLFGRMTIYAAQNAYRRIRAVIRSDNNLALMFYRSVGFRLSAPKQGKTVALYDLGD